MKVVEQAVQSFYKTGFGPGGRLEDPYAALIFTSWQERATQESHKSVSQQARQLGLPILERTAGVMAGDEGRHSKFYIPVVEKTFDEDPNGAMISLNNVIDYGIVMPGAQMPDFELFSGVSSGIGIYNLQKYLSIYRELITAWDVEHRSVEGEASEAQDKILRKYEILSKRADRYTSNLSGELASPWINNSSEFFADGRVELVLKPGELASVG